MSDLAHEMAQWEIHALRGLTATLLYAIELLDSNPNEGHLTPQGVVTLCREAYDEFVRQRMVAFTDPDYRRAIIRRTPC